VTTVTGEHLLEKRCLVLLWYRLVENLDRRDVGAAFVQREDRAWSQSIVRGRLRQESHPRFSGIALQDRR
jgi:hypothetical protein